MGVVAIIADGCRFLVSSIGIALSVIVLRSTLCISRTIRSTVADLVAPCAEMVKAGVWQTLAHRLWARRRIYGRIGGGLATFLVLIHTLGVTLVARL